MADAPLASLIGRITVNFLTGGKVRHHSTVNDYRRVQGLVQQPILMI
jgi:hypothetical protein